MQLKRPFGDKTILCNVPPELPSDTFNANVIFNVGNGIKTPFGDFSIATFLSRYLAGNRSLKQARLVSRKRLALVSSQVGYLDPEALELHQQIQRYIKAKQMIVDTSEQTTETILALNRCIASEQDGTGRYRQHQNFVGGKNVFTARYVCPPVDLVDGLMNNWLNFHNNSTDTPIVRAIIAHSRLNAIHPFTDGNGRTARIFLDSLLETAYGDRVPLLIYLLTSVEKVDAYLEALNLLAVGDCKGLSHPFWFEAITWGEQLQEKMVVALKIAKKQINSKTGMRMLSPASVKLLKHIWSQPIVCQNGLLNLFDMDMTLVRTSITELTGMGILQMRRLREPHNAVIYDCPIIFAAYQTMDDAIFSL